VLDYQVRDISIIHTMAQRLSPTRLAAVAVLLFSSLVASQATFLWASPISRSGWVASADSFQTGFEPSKAIDGNTSTYWLTANSPQVAALPHTLTIDLSKRVVVNGLSYQPRTTTDQGGTIIKHTLAVSNDASTWTTVAQGSYLSDNSLKYTFFTAIVARYVRLTAQSDIAGQQLSSAAELNVYTPNPAVSVDSFVAEPPSKGRWGPTIQLPIVPSSAFVNTDGTVVLWSAYRIDTFPGGTGGTFIATYNPSNGDISSSAVTNIQHDMFCPGTSIDEQGRVVVSGGNDEARTSIYTPSTKAWTSLANMNRPRGYQAQVTLADGRFFVIGGSWSGAVGGKHGEIYNPATNVWTKLDGCNVTRIQTLDPAGPYKSDNHAWLFAWKGNSVFHAGPSTRMNWFNVSGTGSWVAAGNRGSDTDSMSGTAALYDAENGLIVTTGGTTQYAGTASTKNVHTIQLGSVNQNPTVTKVQDMAFARSYHNSVILPNGQVFVVGGQSFARNFQDTDTILPTELFSPDTKTWTQMAPISVPRNYHSVALLLPDARVISSGGGLCGKGCAANHPDAQIWTPPYLLKSDGTAATRPTISSVSAATFKPGATIQITTDVASTFALVRYGSVTHTVNTDQRRIVLKTTASGLTYTATLPTDAGILVPGPYMLFALNSAGVPSLAKNIRVVLT
jgi:galactose oxidase